MNARTVERREIKSTPLAFSSQMRPTNSAVLSRPQISTMTPSASPVQAPTKVLPTPVPAESIDLDGSGYNPKTDRDPTLSPDDLARLALLNSQSRSQPHRRQARVEDRIHLNGIIVSARRVNAIINGDRVGVHGVVLGVRIVKITSTCVEFEYKNRSFTKCIEK